MVGPRAGVPRKHRAPFRCLQGREASELLHHWSDQPVGCRAWHPTPERRVVPSVPPGGGTRGTARWPQGAHLRRRQRPLDRLGHCPGIPCPGRVGRLQLGRKHDRQASAAAGRPPRVDVRRAVRRPRRRPDPARVRAVEGPRGIARHPRPCARLRQTRGPRRGVRQHVARGLRARPRHQRLLARRAGPRGPAADAHRLQAS